MGVGRPLCYRVGCARCARPLHVRHVSRLRFHVSRSSCKIGALYCLQCAREIREWECATALEAMEAAERAVAVRRP